MKKSILILGIVSLMASCNKGQSLDLSTVDFNKDSKEYAIAELSPSRVEQQKGHYEIAYDKSLSESEAKDLNSNVSLTLKDNGEKVTVYHFDDQKSGSHINYHQEPLDFTFGTKIVDYNGKVSFISTSIERQKTLAFITELLKSLGKPSEIIEGRREIDAVDKNVMAGLSKVLPSAKVSTDDFGNEIYSFPETIVWAKNDVLYQLTLNPAKNDITNTLVMISKKAFKDKIVMGYHNPDQDPLLSKYVK
ncbi:hypothetical protein VUJ46_09345 [Chryseobacterium sp. MYb264]|uniref:hypothetical protein n=1 Tax=Chryseobacterium sp. MYb264 TaxID=2745153 RepID=UPI002E118AA4|nr:hypothetical protein VUJ46_09345 [Chryseobacterium sp. MYb264]